MPNIDAIAGWWLWTMLAVSAAACGQSAAACGQSAAACGQSAAAADWDVATLDQDAVSSLQELSAQAAVIFAGQVTAVEHRGSRAGLGDDASGLVEVRFRVDAALRGCMDGQTYVLREWAGLWAGRTPRYHVGERLLMLLPAPVHGGLSAPVGGTDGAIPLLATAPPPLLRDADGRVPRDAADAAPHGTERSGTTDRSRLIASLRPDLRWVRARVTHRTAGSGTTAGSAGLADVLALLGAVDGAR